MKVKDLIEELKSIDPEMIVVANLGNLNATYIEVQFIDILPCVLSKAKRETESDVYYHQGNVPVHCINGEKVLCLRID